MEAESLPTLEAARSWWEALEPEAAGGPFSSWEWASIWWDAHGSGRALDLRLVRDGERPVALLPLYRTRMLGVPVLRMLGHGAADQLGPVCAPGDAAAAAAALQDAARSLPPGGVLLADRLPNQAGLPAGLPGVALRAESSPVLVREGRTWDEWLADRSSNFRQEVRRRERRLAREHELAFRLTEDPERLDADLDVLFALHRARWAAEGDGSTGFGRAEAFHRRFARRALERGWLRLWIADVDGRPAAAWYGLRFGGDEWYYQAGRDPQWDRYAVGTVMLAHSIRSAFEDGVGTYRFGLGDESYKARFSSGDPGLTTLVLGGAARRAVAGAVWALGRAPRPLRRRLLGRVT